MKGEMKSEIKAYYGGIAKRVISNAKSSCGCSASCCGTASEESKLYTKEYINGLPEDAVNASLGCANPISIANLKDGDTVLDLGSGGGIDVFIASKYVGSSGKVYGLDMTDDMLKLANRNKEKMGIENIEFIKGYIEDIPMPDKSVDVILSNCVINLCESKEDALKETYRVLKDNGRLAIADVVMLKEVPENIRLNIEMWVGCIAGALSIEQYKNILKGIGFKDIEIIPVNFYTKEIVKEVAESKGLKDLYDKTDKDLIDGAFAGAFVKASK